MKISLLIFAGLCLIEHHLAQVLEAGSCNKNIETVKNFEPSRYIGRWYENQKYPFIFEAGGKCIYAEYGELENGEISVYNFNINEITGKPSNIQGSAKIVGNGKLKVKFTSIPAFIGESDYWILDTDYDNYAVVYSCSDIGELVNGKVVWILTRQREPHPEVVAQARSIIEKSGLALDPLILTDQSGCESVL